MEVIESNFTEQALVTVDNVQLKSEYQNELPENAKKVMCVTCQVLVQNTAVNDTEATLTGNLVLRTIFINELDKYDSQEVVQPFEKKLAVKDLALYNHVFGQMNIANTNWHVQDKMINITVLMNVTIKGVKSHDVRVVSNLTGEVEVRQVENKMLMFHAPLHEKFTIEENLELESTCEGILGVDAGAIVKDVAAADGKVTIKGLVAANVIGVKTSDTGSVPYNGLHEIEFAKSLTVAGITDADLACGAVCITAVNMHVENSNNKGSVLVLKIDLQFNGCTYVYQTLPTVVDAISFDKELTFETSQVVHHEIIPQVNTTVDIESNLNLPANSPYIARVLAVDGIKVNNLQVTAADGKTVVEGVLVANVLVENEEHLVSNYLAETPFQTHVRIDVMDSEYAVEAAVTPLMLNIKARRGVELLIDAQLGISVQANNQKAMTVVTAVNVGKDKADDGSAIRIYMIGDKENLWDLAKRTNLSCAELLKQNPNLNNGCTPGERIVVYRHENVCL